MQRGAGVGLALLLFGPVSADSWRDNSFVLVTSDAGEQRLLVLEGSATAVVIAKIQAPQNPDRQNALRLLQSLVDADRVRGLTLLAGETDRDSLDMAIASLVDASPEVREEAEQLVAEHPLAAPALRNLFADDEDD
ncbi:MAG: hypothetical protein AAFN50_02885 [Pseudomonadota bacterium]